MNMVACNNSYRALGCIICMMVLQYFVAIFFVKYEDKS